MVRDRRFVGFFVVTHCTLQKKGPHRGGKAGQDGSLPYAVGWAWCRPGLVTLRASEGSVLRRTLRVPTRWRKAVGLGVDI
jgi:hypothetical protein